MSLVLRESMSPDLPWGSCFSKGSESFDECSSWGARLRYTKEDRHRINDLWSWRGVEGKGEREYERRPAVFVIGRRALGGSPLLLMDERISWTGDIEVSEWVIMGTRKHGQTHEREGKSIEERNRRNGSWWAARREQKLNKQGLGNDDLIGDSKERESERIPSQSIIQSCCG